MNEVFSNFSEEFLNTAASRDITIKDFATQVLTAVFSPIVNTNNQEDQIFTKEEQQTLFKAWKVRNQQIMEQALLAVYQEGVKVGSSSTPREPEVQQEEQAAKWSQK